VIAGQRAVVSGSGHDRRSVGGGLAADSGGVERASSSYLRQEIASTARDLAKPKATTLPFAIATLQACPVLKQSTGSAIPRPIDLLRPVGRPPPALHAEQSHGRAQ